MQDEIDSYEKLLDAGRLSAAAEERPIPAEAEQVGHPTLPVLELLRRILHFDP